MRQHVMISIQQCLHNVSQPHNLIFYNFLTVMGEADCWCGWLRQFGQGFQERWRRGGDSGEGRQGLAPVITNFLWRRSCCQAQMGLSLFQVNSKQLRLGNSSDHPSFRETKSQSQLFIAGHAIFSIKLLTTYNKECQKKILGNSKNISCLMKTHFRTQCWCHRTLRDAG